MNKDVKDTVISLAKKAEDAHDANDAMKYSQAALNVANAGVALKAFTD